MLRVCIAAIFLVQSVASFSQSPLLWSNKNFARRSNSKSTSVLHQSSSTTTTSSNDEKSTDDGPNVSIEYCTGCRWGLRSSWYQQELLTTFHDEMGSVTLIPSKPPSPGGTFIVKLNSDTIWDRKTDGGFPEAKQLKQRVRDKIAPSKDLGHSDNTNNEQKEGNEDCEECNDNVTKSADGSSALDEGANAEDDNSTLSKNIEIAYCTGCKWMLRSAWMSQELLSTFQEELRSVTLTPCRRKEDGGKFVSIKKYHENAIRLLERRRSSEFQSFFV